MKTKSRKTAKKTQTATQFQPGIVAFLIALVAVLSLTLLAYLGVIFS